MCKEELKFKDKIGFFSLFLLSDWERKVKVRKISKRKKNMTKEKEG